MTKIAVLAAAASIGCAAPALAAGAVALPRAGYGRAPSHYSPMIVQAPPNFAGRAVASPVAPTHLPPPPVSIRNRGIPATPGL